MTKNRGVCMFNKLFVSISLCLIPSVVMAVTMYREVCPDGYVTVERPYVKLMDGLCMMPYTCSPFVNDAYSCLYGTPNNICYLYAEPSRYTESSGVVFKLTNMCPINGGTGIASYGVTKCVNAYSGGNASLINQNCKSFTGLTNSPDSIKVCDNSEYVMLGACSTTAASGISVKTDIEQGVGGNYCWCRMISPAVSDWAFYQDYSDEASCLKNCGQMCSRVSISFGRVLMYSENWY